jgi:hypothetical protein
VWGCVGNLTRPEAFGSQGLPRLCFVLSMAESLPVVPIVACRSDKCAYQAERVSSPMKHAPCREGARPKVEGVGSGSRSEARSNAAEYKNSTNEASMSLKTHDGIGKLTQNEPMNEPGFECHMRELNSNSELLVQHASRHGSCAPKCGRARIRSAAGSLEQPEKNTRNIRTKLVCY